MAALANDSYSAASGNSIVAGRSVAPSIAGSVWTPARDASGNVAVGNWLGLPLNTWLDVAGQSVNNVVETPHLLSNWGSDSATSIAAAWCGAAWDYVNQRMYIMGGGHGDGSCCEMGIYMLDAAKLQFTRVRDRDPIEQAGGWNYTAGAYQAGEQWNGGNAPLLNGNPGSMHTYWGVVWIPPEVMGNTNGGMYYPGLAKAVWNFDTHAWTTTHWFSPLHDGAVDWSNCASFVDGSAIYGPRANWAHFKFDLTQTESTDASATSFGALTLQYSTADKQSNAGSAAWGLMRERRETFSFSAGGSRVRVRYGAALDASATNWSSYSDNITLTSSDGSHADFNGTTLTDSANLCAAGSGYDHATQTLYLMGNTVGGQLYKITGLSTNTWNVEKVAGTGALRTAAQGAYGRVRMATFSGKLFLLRVSGTTHPLQVMRIT